MFLFIQPLCLFSSINLFITNEALLDFKIVLHSALQVLLFENPNKVLLDVKDFEQIIQNFSLFFGFTTVKFL